ncbi:MAG: pantoate--beta-alanine ligase [Myxococcota bacterium]|nr:pantoate--beta-alanine ligase [Myxococcota bacterium]
MHVVGKVKELQALADSERAAGRRIALVPTMGALHAGHISLVEEARKHADIVWVSIFVNPTQFNDSKDYDAYPDTLEGDSEKCEAAGVDALFVPTPGELYPEGAQTWVEVTELAKPLCGAARPGHFNGVTSVVSKLFLAAKPHVAVFGEKDFQQLAVVRRMTRDLCFDVDIVGAAIAREPDGLAMSSRNVHLDAEARHQARALVSALDAAEQAVSEGVLETSQLLAIVKEELTKAPRASIDYAEIRSPETLELAPTHLDGPALLALALYFEPATDRPDAPKVRLIDNRVLTPADAGSADFVTRRSQS